MAEEGLARLARLAAAAGLTGIEQSSHYGNPALKVDGKGFAGVKEDNLVSLRIPMEQKEFLLEVAPEIYFETDHYKGWPWLLLRLKTISDEELTQRLIDAWKFRAPKKLAAAWAAQAPGQA